MLRVASVGVGIGQCASRKSPFFNRVLPGSSWTRIAQACLHSQRASIAAALPSSRASNAHAQVPQHALLVAPRHRLSHVRWHGGGHGHSHGGLLDDEEDQDALNLQGKDAADADRITWIGVYINVVLSGAKAFAGVSFHSAGLLADAVHSMSDLVSDGITLLALKYCTRPPDQFQPYGYGKYETMGALTVSLLLVGGSLGIINHSFDTLLLLVDPVAVPSLAALDAKLASLSMDPEIVEAIKASIPHSLGGGTETAVEAALAQAHSHAHSSELMLHPAALGIAAVSVAAKEALYRATITVGNRINSSVLIANAWHHRSDAVTSVVAMAGIGLSLAGFPVFDPMAGMLVGGIILKMGGEIGWDAIKDLCDAQLPVKVVDKLNRAAQSMVEESKGEIVQVRQLRSRKIGRRLHVDLTLVMRDGDHAVSFERACQWKQRVKDSIQKQVPRVKDIVVELATSTQASSTIFDYEHIVHSDDAHSDDHHGHGHGHGHGHAHSHGVAPVASVSGVQGHRHSHNDGP